MIKDPNLLRDYQSLISEQHKLGIIELNDFEKPDKSCIHFLLHHPVIKYNRSTTKVRIVYDGSASTGDDVSLNDCLQVGPNMIPKLFNMLIRFRCHQITLVADIEKAFLMVSVAEEDRNMLRFLWLKDPLKMDSEIIQFQFARLEALISYFRGSHSLHLAKYCCEYPG